MHPEGRHSPPDRYRVLLGQLWTLPGPARARGFVSYDVATARVEPHLVAVTQPRSAYCEQFRSLRTRILQAGERGQLKTSVITLPAWAKAKR